MPTGTAATQRLTLPSVMVDESAGMPISLNGTSGRAAPPPPAADDGGRATKKRGGKTPEINQENQLKTENEKQTYQVPVSYSTYFQVERTEDKEGEEAANNNEN